VIREHSRFQLEATKLGRDVVFQVTVFEKRERRGTRLYAETQCSDPYHYIIQFIIREAQSFDEVVTKFERLLLHRGFTPLRFRVFGTDERFNVQKWLEWQIIDPTNLPVEEDETQTNGGNGVIP
jgi:hypothetical protein